MLKKCKAEFCPMKRTCKRYTEKKDNPKFGNFKWKTNKEHFPYCEHYLYNGKIGV